MAKVNFKFDSRSAANKVLKSFGKVKKSRQLNKEVAEFIIGRVAGEARRGKPLNDSRKFPKLKDSSVAIRDALKKSGLDKTHPAFTPPFSNVTITGQLVDALTFIFRFGALEIFVKKSPRKPYKFKVGKNKEKTPSNYDLDQELRSRGFKFFTGSGVKKSVQIRKRVNTIVKKALRRAIGVSQKLDKL